VTARPILTDPDTGIPDLIHRLTDDSKRLVTDEVHLAKIEAKESLHRATKGALWMTLAFGVSIIMLVALTVFVATLIGRLANDHMWIGALVTGALELAVGAWLIKRGMTAFARPSYTMVETRHTIAETTHWVGSARSG
jgi:uncharacterized membrane protein YqjE